MTNKTQPRETASSKKQSSTPKKRRTSQATRLYENDLEYLQDELSWIEARARRIGAQIRIQTLEAGEELPSRGQWGKRKNEESPWGLQKARDQYHGREKRLRKKIDLRVSAHRDAGLPLALDSLCDSCGLDDFAAH